MGKRRRNNGVQDAQDLDTKFNVHHMQRAVVSSGIGSKAKGIGIEAVQTVVDQFDAAERRTLAITGGVHDPRQRAAAKIFKKKLPRYQSAVDILENASDNTSVVLPSFSEIQEFERLLKEYLKQARETECSKQGLPSGKSLRKKFGIESSKKAKTEQIFAKRNVVTALPKSTSVQKHSAAKKQKRKNKKSTMGLNKDVSMD